MSLRIGRLFGINLYIHWSFWLLPLWVVFAQAQNPEAGSLGLHLALLGALFGCVVLHEYGHALMARVFGIGTRDVTLYPIGGVARLEHMSEKPWEEFCIALAGPMVNVVIAAGLGLGLLAAFWVQPGFLHGLAGEFLVALLILNVGLFVFNLLPAFPMDGGRILRALLSVPMGRLPATRAAVIVSVGLAVLFSLAGVLIWNNPWVMLVGLFVIWAGHQELRALEMRERESADGEPVTPEILPHDIASGWHGVPRSAVTVYIWDPRKHEWIPQGVISSHRF